MAATAATAATVTTATATKVVDAPKADWRQRAVRDADGRFVSPWLKEGADGRRPTSMQLVRWLTKRNPPPPPPPGTFPVVNPDFQVDEGEVKCTWIGHATCLLQVAGVNVLTDAVFSQRCSPVQWAGPKRYVPPACSIADLPHIHLVLISHDHYDHLDYYSICELERRFQPHFVCGLELGAWFCATAHVPKSRVLELDWWQSASLCNDKVTVQFVPVQHWSKRQAFNDERRTLWGGFSVCVDSFKFFFNGDTGYHEELYAELGRRCGPFDLCAIPIGAYEPRAIMTPQHVNPEEAYLIHQHLGSKLSLGIHHATFVLTDEPVKEPAERMRALCAAHPDGAPFVAIQHGSSIVFAKDRSAHIAHEMQSPPDTSV